MTSLLDEFSDSFFLVWGTAIALLIGHRYSIDFDLFLPNADTLPREKIDRILRRSPYTWQVLVDTDIHYEILIAGVKITWYAYPYNLNAGSKKLSQLRIPPLITLAVMKAHAIQRRAKWKDYVDIAILTKYVSLPSILEEAEHMYGWAFSSKLFAAQLIYTEDVDYTEEVERLEGFEKKRSEILSVLHSMSLEIGEMKA